MDRLPRLACVAIALGVTAPAIDAAQRPILLSRAQSGLWEISGARDLPGPSRVCLADPAMLVQIQHRNAKCTRDVVRDLPGSAEVHYNCASAGFGQTKISMVTPRSLRIETQGIAGNSPFHYVLQARRVGNCPGH